MNSGHWPPQRLGVNSKEQLKNDHSLGGAPQQTVANGWHTNDLLEVQARVAAESSGALHAEYRTGVILVLLLGLGLLGDRALRMWDQQQATNQPTPGT